MTGFGSGAPRSATPYSVSMPTIFGTATDGSLPAGPRRLARFCELQPRFLRHRLGPGAASRCVRKGRSTIRYDSVATTKATPTSVTVKSGRQNGDGIGAKGRAHTSPCTRIG